jgi:hypothetical protein
MSELSAASHNFADRFRLSQPAAGATFRPLTGAERNSSFPLTMRTELFWSRENFSRFVPMNLHVIQRIGGTLDDDAMRRSLRTLIERHEALRTRLSIAGGVPSQIVQSDFEPLIEVIPLTHTSAGTRRQQETALMAEFVQRPIDLMAEPTFRVLIVRTDEQHFLLALLLHHYLGDAKSLDIVAKELMVLYAAELRQQTATLPRASHQYVDYALWQRHLAARRVEEYLARLHRSVEGFEHSAYQLRAPRDRGHTDWTTFNVASDVVTPLLARATATDTPIVSLLMLAHQVSLARWTATTDVVTAMPMAARVRPEYANTVGYLVNAIPIRTNLKRHPGLDGHVADIKRDILTGLIWQDISYELLESLLPSGRPLCSTMFNYIPRMIAGAARDIPDFEISEFQSGEFIAAIADRPRVRVVADFVVYFMELPGSFGCEIIFNSDRFSRRDLDVYSRLFVGVLREIAP